MDHHDVVFNPLEPLTAFLEEAEDNFLQFLDSIVASAPPQLREVLFESEQKTMGRAVAADLFDVIPVIGDISNLFRVRHAGNLEDRPRGRVTRQTVDLLLGALPPPVGGALDFLTPSGIITYLREGRR